MKRTAMRPKEVTKNDINTKQNEKLKQNNAFIGKRKKIMKETD